MPKLKTKSSAKKRFKITAKGKVIMAQAGKRHGMIKRSNSQIRKLRGTTVMSKQDGKIVISKVNGVEEKARLESLNKRWKKQCNMHIEIAEIKRENSNLCGYKG